MLASCFEPLEGRCLLSATLTNGILQVLGTPGDDTILAELKDTDHTRIQITINGVTKNFAKSSVTKVQIYGKQGNDTITIDDNLGKPDYVSGGTGNDTIKGGPAADNIWGGPGNDTLSGRGGDDSIHGGAGDDSILGGPGADKLWGNRGTDLFFETDAASEYQDFGFISE